MTNSTSPILVIDDEEGIRDYVRFVLEKAGRTVYDAADGSAGIQLLEDHADAIVITDLVMPGKEGIETIVAMRRANSCVRIIAMSGVGNKDTYLKLAQGIGADGSLSKPFTSAELLAAVAAVSKKCAD